ncbi:MAG TPA: hypothetical protein PLQ56_02560 [Aggregatilineales bacterium]|nr:PD40 domain-containing protein [Anaerolineae bacterium]HUN05448.1 hypothetical protein [Aggregatilineales bacterium]
MAILRLYLKLTLASVSLFLFSQILINSISYREATTESFGRVAFASLRSLDSNDANNMLDVSSSTVSILNVEDFSISIFDPMIPINPLFFSWSYDYRYLAYSNGYDIYVYDTLTGTSINLTDDGDTTYANYFHWSPAEYLLAFTSIKDTSSSRQYQLLIYDLNNQYTYKLADGLSILDMDWSPDGSQIIFSASEENSLVRDIYLVQANGSNLRQLTHTDSVEFHSIWSHDGSYILYLSGAGQRISNEDKYKLNIEDIYTNISSVLLSDASYTVGGPGWLWDDTSILYSVEHSSYKSLRLVDIETKIDLTLINVDGLQGFDVSRDGYGLVYTTSDKHICLFSLINLSQRCIKSNMYPFTIPYWN